MSYRWNSWFHYLGCHCFSLPHGVSVDNWTVSTVEVREPCTSQEGWPFEIPLQGLHNLATCHYVPELLAAMAQTL